MKDLSVLLGEKMGQIIPRLNQSTDQESTQATQNLSKHSNKPDLSRAIDGHTYSAKTTRDLRPLWAKSIPECFRRLSIENCKEVPFRILTECLENLINRISLFFYGEWGCGKTTTAFALINQIMEISSGNFWPRYMSARELDNHLLNASRSEFGDAYELQKLSECDLLFIDDLCKIQPTERFKSQLFEIINKRYLDKKITIITSNKNLDQMGAIFDGSIVSRMMDKSVWDVVKFEDVDLRKNQSKPF